MTTLKFRVENAAVTTITEEITQGGRTGSFSYEVANFEALLVDGDGPTFTFRLPPEAISEFPEGSILTVTVSADPTPAGVTV